MRSKRPLLTEQTALVWDAPGLVAGVDEAGRGPLAGPVVAGLAQGAVASSESRVLGTGDGMALSPVAYFAQFALDCPAVAMTVIAGIGVRRR